MPQPQAYDRTVDFTERDGDDTNHAGMNAELDAAALSINQIRQNLALIQKDDGTLQNGIVGADQLAPSAFDAVQARLDEATQEAQNAAQSALTSALTATQAASDAANSIAVVQQAETASLLNAQNALASATAAQANAGSVATSAANASTSASTASTSATNAANSAGAAAASAASAANSAGAAAASAASAANSASTATTQAGNAATSATSASGSAASAASSANAAATSASAAATSAASINPANLVSLTGDQTIGGVKTFSSAPVVPGINSGQLAGMRNKIINGACQIAQRGTVTLTNTIASYGGCDRIFGKTSGFSAATASLSQDGNIDYGPTDFGQRIFISSSSGAGQVTFGTRLESFDTADLHDGFVTISVYVYHDTGLNISTQLQLNVANALNNFSGITQIGISGATVVPSGVVTRLTYTVAYDVAFPKNGLDVRVLFIGVPALTNKSFYISGWQLEKGSVATPFEHRPIGAELALCQRYYEFIPGANVKAAGYSTAGTEGSRQYFGFAVTKRAAPTLGFPTAAAANCSLSSNVSTSGFNVTATVISTGAFGYDYGSGNVTASIEL